MTQKQIIASKLAVENGGNVSKAMIDAGYSPATAKNPSKLTRSKAYKEIVLPKLKKHGVSLNKYIRNVGEAMDATKTVILGSGDDAFADVVPDHATRLQGNKQAEKLLKIDQLVNSDNSNDSDDIPFSAEQLEGMDEIELQRVVFRKDKKPEQDSKA